MLFILLLNSNLCLTGIAILFSSLAKNTTAYTKTFSFLCDIVIFIRGGGDTGQAASANPSLVSYKVSAERICSRRISKATVYIAKVGGLITQFREMKRGVIEISLKTRFSAFIMPSCLGPASISNTADYCL